MKELICRCGHTETQHNCYDEENQEFTEKYGCGVKGCNCESFNEIQASQQKEQISGEKK